MHKKNYFHRDLKPGNILLTELEGDHIRVIDFGIAKVLAEVESEEGPRTGTGLVLGTVRYMAPEQLKDGGLIGPPSDLYSLGVLFYQMVTGNTPFDGSQAEMAAGHLYKDPPLLPKAVLEQFAVAARDLQTWLSKCLEKEPENRYEDATTMRLALQEVLPTMATEPHQMRTNGAQDTLRLDSQSIHSRLKSNTLDDGGHDIGDSFGVSESEMGTDPEAFRHRFETRSMPHTVKVESRNRIQDRTETETLDEPEPIAITSPRRRHNENTLNEIGPGNDSGHRDTQDENGQPRHRRPRSGQRNPLPITDAPQPKTDPMYGESDRTEDHHQEADGNTKGGNASSLVVRRIINRDTGPTHDTLRFQQMARGVPSDGSSSIRTRGELGLSTPQERRITWALPLSAVGFFLAGLLWLQPFADHEPQPSGQTPSNQVEELPSIYREPDNTGSPDETRKPKVGPEVDAEIKSESEGGPPTPRYDIDQSDATADQVETGEIKEPLTAEKTKRPEADAQPNKRTIEAKPKRKRKVRGRRVRSTKGSRDKRPSKATAKSRISTAKNRAAQTNLRAEIKIGSALEECRCEKAGMLLQGLPGTYPAGKRRILETKVSQCRVPTVDEHCVDGKVQ